MLDGFSASYDSDTQVQYISDERRQFFSETLTQGTIHEILEKHFSGKISQIPPKYSALKIQGKRALDRTLAWEDIVMKARQAEILSWDIVEYSYPRLVVDIRVSSGTYIRSIAHDLWEILETWGYLSALRRTSIGDLDISEAYVYSQTDTPEDIPSYDIQKLFWERLVLLDDEGIYLRLSQWQRVPIDGVFPENINFLLFDGKNIRYMVEYKGGVIHPRKKIT